MSDRKASEIGLPTYEASVSCGAWCQGGSVNMQPTTYAEHERAEFVWVRGDTALAEIERLRRELAVRDVEKAALLVANDDAHRWLAEARGLLNSAVFWVRPHNGDLARVIDALLASVDGGITHK